MRGSLRDSIGAKQIKKRGWAHHQGNIMNKRLHFKALIVTVLNLGRPFRQGICLALLAAICLPRVAFCGGVVSHTDEADLLAAMSGGGTVTFAVSGTIYLTNTIVVSNNTALNATGQNVAISGSNAVQIFSINSNTTVAITNLIMKDGYGGNGGAIYNAGMLQLTTCTFINCRAVPWADQEGFYPNPGYGGAIYNTGSLQMTGCAFNNNSVNNSVSDEDSEFGMDSFGGAAYNTGSLQIIRCTFDNNSAVGGSSLGLGGAGGGGAVYSMGIITVMGSEFSGNSAVGPDGTSYFDGGGWAGGSANGGAIYMSGQATFNNCVFSNNTANGGAGGLSTTPSYVGEGGDASGGGIFSTGVESIYDTTFVGNQAVGGAGAAGASEFGPGAGGLGGNGTGGGLCIQAGMLAMVNSTFSGNAVDGSAGGMGGNSFDSEPGGTGGNGGSGIGGGMGVLAGTAALTNVTLADNISTGGAAGLGGGNGAANGMPGLSEGQNLANTGGSIILLNSILNCSPGSNNGFGAIVDAGYNLDSDSTGYLTNSTSLNNKNPDLGPLGNYGGPTPTVPLLADSPAIDAADPSSFPARDQRGVPRPYGSAPCIGAFEYSGPIESLNVSITNVTVDFLGVPGDQYVVQRSTNLVQGSGWASIGTNTAPANGLIQVVDNFLGLGNPVPPSAYYRLRTPSN